MSELQSYYDNYCRPGVWSHEDPELCGCRGSGWWLSDLDTWHECYHHNTGQPHPEEDYYGEASAPESVPEGKALVGYRMGTPVYEDVQTCDPEDDDLPF